MGIYGLTNSLYHPGGAQLWENMIVTYFFKSETQWSFVLGGIRTHNLLIVGQTTKPPCLGVQQEGQVDSLYPTGSQKD